MIEEELISNCLDDFYVGAASRNTPKSINEAIQKNVSIEQLLKTRMYHLRLNEEITRNTEAVKKDLMNLLTEMNYNLTTIQIIQNRIQNEVDSNYLLTLMKENDPESKLQTKKLLNLLNKIQKIGSNINEITDETKQITKDIYETEIEIIQEQEKIRKLQEKLKKEENVDQISEEEKLTILKRIDRINYMKLLITQLIINSGVKLSEKPQLVEMICHCKEKITFDSIVNKISKEEEESLQQSQAITSTFGVSKTGIGAESK